MGGMMGGSARGGGQPCADWRACANKGGTFGMEVLIGQLCKGGGSGGAAVLIGGVVRMGEGLPGGSGEGNVS